MAPRNQKISPKNRISKFAPREVFLWPPKWCYRKSDFTSRFPVVWRSRIGIFIFSAQNYKKLQACSYARRRFSDKQDFRGPERNRCPERNSGELVLQNLVGFCSKPLVNFWCSQNVASTILQRVRTNTAQVFCFCLVFPLFSPVFDPSKNGWKQRKNQARTTDLRGSGSYAL